MQKVIDFHTHIFPDALAPRGLAVLAHNAEGLYTPVHNMTLDGMLDFMDRAGISQSVVLPVLTKREQVFKTNEWVASVKSNKIIPFGGVYPSEHYKEDIDFVCSLGLKGIKLHPEYQHFDIDSDEMLHFYDYAFSRGLIIVEHAGFDPAFPPPFHTSPQKFQHVWNEMQGGTMIVAHLGGHAQWDDVEKYIVGTGLYMDTSMGTEYYEKEQFLRIVKYHGSDKILFGSDSPWSDGGKEVANLQRISLGDSDLQNILHLNAERILNV